MKNQPLPHARGSMNECEYDRMIGELVHRCDKRDAITNSRHLVGNMGSAKPGMKSAFIKFKASKIPGMT
jgi:hypothetical protein